jgi:flagellar biosynthesis protein FlhG
VDDYERPISDTLPPPSKLPRGKRVIAVGGGRGGVGKSTLTVNLGVYFAQLGRAVVVWDVDREGAHLHSMVGVRTAPVVPYDADGEAKVKLCATTVPGLMLMPTAYDVLAMSPSRPARASEWRTKLDGLEADYVIIHFGSS